MKKTAHIISHTHWDREWYLPYETHHMMLIKTMDTLLDTFEKDPNFKYYHLDGQTVLLEDYLEVRPDKKELLEKVIKEGRLNIGPWYVLQDEFLTSSEANIRNLQYGHKDSKKYGVEPCKVGYFPDSFGNIGQAPQILKQAGIDAAAFGRGVKPTGFNNEISADDKFESPYSEMYWESPDGSKVLGILFANWYCNGMEVPVDGKEAKEYWEKRIEDASKFASCNHLLFMNGCDHQPIQTDLSQAINFANNLYNDIEFVHSNFEDYIKDLKENMPKDLQVIKGELRSQQTEGWYTLVNTASARVYLKQWNNLCQTLFEKVAEPIATMASHYGYKYPHHLFEYGWKSLMKNHPHDSICGCSVDEVHREMVARFDKAKDVAKFIINESLEYIKDNINTEVFSKLGDNTYPFIVVNTSGYDRFSVTTIEMDICRKYFREGTPNLIAKELKKVEIPKFKVVDVNGNKIDANIVDMGIRFGYDLPDDKFRQPYYARYVKVELLTKNIKSFGWDTYALVEDNDITIENKTIVVNNNILENENLRVEIKENGSVELLDKNTNKVFKDLCIYENSGDIGNEYIYMKPVGEAPITTKDIKADIKVKENLSYKGVIEITHKLNIPKSANELLLEEIEEVLEFKHRKSQRVDETVELEIKTTLTLEKNDKGLKIKSSLNNVANDHRMRMLFATDIESDVHYADSIFELAKRNNIVDGCWKNPSNCQHQQAFVNIHNKDYGLTVANKGLNEYELLNDGRNTIAVTLLRCVRELGDWGVFETPDAQCIGYHEAELKIIPHGRNMYDSIKEAHMYQIPVITKQVDIKNGKINYENGLMNFDGYGIIWSTLKMGNDFNTIFRVYNVSDKDTSLEISKCDFGKEIYISNILEEEIKSVIDGKVNLRKSEISTISIR
ncbi:MULTISPECIES: alpha-mannosidase [Romboutsia]|jgi:alpha-mannosidase|uniref:alpha-mannosidase n=1 Tax=Romboutsia TaxID=1501226 RepID=UPI002170ED65|nr:MULTISPECIES: alpha-mannosidase [Romboutsia]MCI9061222.1 alpha-mannosidase [Romboutsia sp.]